MKINLKYLTWILKIHLFQTKVFLMKEKKVMRTCNNYKTKKFIYKTI